ncbi:hypothetical protein AVEN_223802-1 [Araneus ventricosus]|uniref:Uncharacterized protein n=1 Tax=Araneus ventricosus TaxID=182803 RepID=A0A4Y2DN72_ARAVE|nr:hypothetical protein AVEN_223802-1 [Araneus ventricosus]
MDSNRLLLFGNKQSRKSIATIDKHKSTIPSLSMRMILNDPAATTLNRALRSPHYSPITGDTCTDPAGRGTALHRLWVTRLHTIIISHRKARLCLLLRQILNPILEVPS